MWSWQNSMRQLESLTGVTTIVPCKPGMGAAEDNSGLSTHERKLAWSCKATLSTHIACQRLELINFFNFFIPACWVTVCEGKIQKNRESIWSGLMCTSSLVEIVWCTTSLRLSLCRWIQMQSECLYSVLWSTVLTL